MIQTPRLKVIQAVLDANAQTPTNERAEKNWSRSPNSATVNCPKDRSSARSLGKAIIRSVRQYGLGSMNYAPLSQQWILIWQMASREAKESRLR